MESLLLGLFGSASLLAVWNAALSTTVWDPKDLTTSGAPPKSLLVAFASVSSFCVLLCLVLIGTAQTGKMNKYREYLIKNS